MATEDRRQQLANDLMRKARHAIRESYSGGSTDVEVTFDVDDDDIRTAAEVLEDRGIATLDGDKVRVRVRLA